MNLVTVANFPLPQDAYVLKSRLEAEDIPFHMKDELTVQTDNFLSNAIGGVKLQVRPTDIERVNAILAELDIQAEKPLPPEALFSKNRLTILAIGGAIIIGVFLYLYLSGSL